MERQEALAVIKRARNIAELDDAVRLEAIMNLEPEERDQVLASVTLDNNARLMRLEGKSLDALVPSPIKLLHLMAASFVAVILAMVGGDIRQSP